MVELVFHHHAGERQAMDEQRRKWANLTVEYLTGFKSIRLLGREYGIGEKSIRNRAKREGWLRLPADAEPSRPSVRDLLLMELDKPGLPTSLRVRTLLALLPGSERQCRPRPFLARRPGASKRPSRRPWASLRRHRRPSSFCSRITGSTRIEHWAKGLPQRTGGRGSTSTSEAP